VQAAWLGKCPDCGAWDALEKFTEPRSAAGDEQPGAGATAAAWSAAVEGGDERSTLARPLPDIESASISRFASGVGEFDRVLGGGLVPGCIVLLGGDPGIGKSTLMLQAAGALAGRGQRVLYVSSEESAYQTRLRAERLFANGDSGAALSALHPLYVLSDTNLGRIAEQARRVRPSVCVIDSIQMIHHGRVEASPGSVAQLRACCMELAGLAKVSGMSIVLVGHVTKDGQLAGPKLLEHLVDVVLSFEGDRHHAHRVVRGMKNRFGTTMEVGLFEMTDRGLAEVSGGCRLDPDRPTQPGSVACPAMHGSRCLVVEIQALTATGFLGNARRKTTGLDGNRLAMLIAVLEKHGGLRLADQDVFASTVGGLRIVEPAADLPLCLAIAGAHLRRTLPRGLAAVGEVGLGGEIRPVPQIDVRSREAGRLGYHALALATEAQKSSRSDANVEHVGVRTVAEALDLMIPAR
jgi:DNA repair protein RadA/Sms